MIEQDIGLVFLSVNQAIRTSDMAAKARNHNVAELATSKQVKLIGRLDIGDIKNLSILIIYEKKFAKLTTQLH